MENSVSCANNSNLGNAKLCRAFCLITPAMKMLSHNVHVATYVHTYNISSYINELYAQNCAYVDIIKPGARRPKAGVRLVS